MTENPRPCPFCGASVRLVRGPIAGTWMFVCDQCGADVCFYGAEKPRNKAVAAWNRRANDERDR